MTEVVKLECGEEPKEGKTRKEIILDKDGNQLCDVWYDRDSGDIVEIQTKPYENKVAEAEHYEEFVCATNDNGEITPERLTRKEVRKQGKQYLIVTSIIFHNREKAFFQHRSEQKELDPGKLSASAHGVAKEVYQNGQRVQKTDDVSEINMALEINEELRHGDGTKQFCVKLWRGTKDELFEFAIKNGIDNPDTVYLVPLAFLKADGYPLGDKQHKRTRALFTGYIFSKETPTVRFDPGESSGIELLDPAEVVGDPKLTDDLKSILNDYL